MFSLQTLELKLPSKWYRRTVGAVEIGAGTLMGAFATRSRTVSNGANIILLLLKVLNVYSHWAINDEFERIAPR